MWGAESQVTSYQGLNQGSQNWDTRALPLRYPTISLLNTDKKEQVLSMQRKSIINLLFYWGFWLSYLTDLLSLRLGVLEARVDDGGDKKNNSYSLLNSVEVSPSA